MKVASVWLLSLTALLFFGGCQDDTTLSDFKSDGCSLFPDRNILSKQDWCECCFQHDLAYWQGGTEEERLLADSELRDCVVAKTGDSRLAEMMFEGVRFGGSPYFYNWYRWGYGWSYERKYKKLSASEKTLVQQKMKAYFASQPTSPCGGMVIIEQCTAGEDDGSSSDMTGLQQ